MNRLGCFAAGIVVGMVVLQVGHALYLRSSDYVTAAMLTWLCGVLVVWAGQFIGEEWM